MAESPSVATFNFLLIVHHATLMPAIEGNGPGFSSSALRSLHVFNLASREGEQQRHSLMNDSLIDVIASCEASSATTCCCAIRLLFYSIATGILSFLK